MRPVLLVGGRARGQRLPEALARFSRRTRTPVLTSPAAKGLMDPAEPWFARTFLNGNIEGELLRRADLVLAAGLDANDFLNSPWPHRARVVAIEPDQTNVQHFLPVKQQVVGDVASVLDALQEGASEWQESDVAAYLATFERLFPSNEARLTIPTALAEARAILPRETLIAVDAGFGKPLTSYLWPAYEPNTCYSAHGLSTMGYALPAANALKLVHPERPVVGFMGDGSLLMRAAEIGVARALGIAPIYVAWIDGSLASFR